MDELHLVRQFFGEHPPPAPDVVAAAKARLLAGEPDRRLPRLHRRALARAAGMTRRDSPVLFRKPMVRRAGSWLLPLAAAAGVVVIALATVFIGHLYSNPATRGGTASGGTASGTGPAITAGFAGFAGYKWTVVTIGHDGKTTSVPARYRVSLQFTPDGHFGANEPVNFHGGRYKVTPGGFTTSELTSTLAGYAGRDPVVLLAIGAISVFDNGTRALTQISGNTLTISVNGYTLIAQRDGTQANWPAPKQT